jgi:2-dehydro-3-deoxy-D-gluconate 5-dehydrogenase
MMKTKSTVLESFQLAGKNALVTGSRKGLGAAIALALAEAGANVGCHGKSADSGGVPEAIRGTGRKAFYVAGDVSEAEVCHQLIDATVSEFGSIDILVNNAGVIRRGPALEFSMEYWDEAIAVNLTSVFRLSQLAARQMVEKKRGGKIVHVASVLSFQGGILVPAYAAAKGGVAQLTKAMANEWAKERINVNAIAPGYMVTDNTTQIRQDASRNDKILDRIPAGRWGQPEDLAGTAVFLCSAASDYVHGHLLTVDGGWLGR